MCILPCQNPLELKTGLEVLLNSWGCSRDMFQNHMMQLLALTATEPPSCLESDFVLDEKSKVFRSLRLFSPGDSTRNVVLGEYDAGTVDGKPVPSYREEPGVSPGAPTPTFAMMKVFVDNCDGREFPSISHRERGLRRR